jgi:methylaspartate ammonia-lyase
MSVIKVKHNLLLKALRAKYEAERAEALATLEIYFENPVGIGEHPQHLEEMAKYLEKLTNADDNIETLNKYFI